MTAVTANLKDLEFPTLVIGSVLSDPSNLTDLMRLTHTGLEKAMRESPAATQELVAGYRVIEDEETLLLTLTLDVDSIPWEDLELDEDTATLVDDLRVALQGKKLAVAVGVVDHFLILSLGPSLDHLTAFGRAQNCVICPGWLV